MADHTTDDTSGDFDDPEPGTTWFIGLAGAIVFTALVLAISVLYYGANSDLEDAVVINQPTQALEELRHAQRQKLVEYSRYTIADADGKPQPKLRIPVKDAMKLLVTEGMPVPPVAPARPAAATGAQG